MILRARIWSATKLYLLSLGLCFTLIADAAAVKEHVIYNFTDAADGADPTALISDATGNLYGATGFTGDYEPGNIFELVRNGSGYSYVVLYTFADDEGVGVSGSLALDTHGNLYGTTSTGGDYFKGSVFELSPNQGDGWTFTVLYSFASETDGGYPSGGVILDQVGNLYGTTYYGGLLSDCEGVGCGVVFELSPGQNGSWTETVLHSFAENEGALLASGLSFGPNGTLYGAASVGGTGKGCEGSPANGCGAVFQLAPSHGGWTETTLHSFTNDNKDGIYGEGVTYYRGKLFGTTLIGGTQDAGTVFELAPSKSGVVETIIHSFGSGKDATQPLGTVVFDGQGNLYGSASEGGNTDCNNRGCGAIFQLAPNNGSWTEKIVHQFTGGSDGAEPNATPILFGPALFGVASGGGANGYGVVFAFTR